MFKIANVLCSLARSLNRHCGSFSLWQYTQTRNQSKCDFFLSYDETEKSRVFLFSFSHSEAHIQKTGVTLFRAVF